MLEEKSLIPTDITIIGGGPAGLFAAFYAGMRKSSVKVIESMPQLGGQLSALYPDKYIYDVAGFPKVTAQELVNQLVKQAELFHPEYCLNEKVLEVHKRNEQLFEIITNKQTHWSKSIIITAGCGAFEPRRIALPNATRFEQTNLFYFVKDVSRFAGLDVVIAGGGDSALDWALMLEPVAKSVTLVHRRDKFRAHEHSVELLEKSSVKIITPREITALHGGSQITSITLSNQKLGITEEIHTDALIVSYGFVSSLGPIANWGISIEEGGIVVNSSMETNISGIYAAGDITYYPGKVKLIAVGFGEAPTAVNNAKRYIDPAAKLQPGHSSSMSL